MSREQPWRRVRLAGMLGTIHGLGRRAHGGMEPLRTGSVSFCGTDCARAAVGWEIPAYAGMTGTGAGMTIPRRGIDGESNLRRHRRNPTHVIPA